MKNTTLLDRHERFFLTSAGALQRDEDRRMRVHIDQLNLRANKRHGADQPVITLKPTVARAGDVKKVHAAYIAGVSSFLQAPDRDIMSCGATVWLETYAPVQVDQPPTQWIGDGPLRYMIVDKDSVCSNKQHDASLLPILSVRDEHGRALGLGGVIDIDGPCRVVYCHEPNPLGTSIWVETRSPLRLDGKVLP